MQRNIDKSKQVLNIKLKLSSYSGLLELTGKQNELVFWIFLVQINEIKFVAKSLKEHDASWNNIQQMNGDLNAATNL